MSESLADLVRETVAVTGAPPPALLDAEAPVLDPSAISDDVNASFYLVGLIGGKEVGKSALVNALAGEPVTLSTAYGPGTESAVAYAHASRKQAVSRLLEQLVPGRWRLVTHQIHALGAMVLIDLPDIDSHYSEHLRTTRSVLRQLLFPVWIGSIEKYADLQPQQMLAQVAAGNAPENFVFCLNKADQVLPVVHNPSEDHADSGQSALEEIRQDHAARIARTLSLPGPPEVFVISATHPASFDLPRLRNRLMRERTPKDVVASKALAARRQEQSMLEWLRRQDLSNRVRRLSNLRRETEDALAERLGTALLDRAMPRLQENAEARSAIADDILEKRVASWPLVNLVHTLLSPPFVFLRSISSRQPAITPGPEASIDASLRDTDEPVAAMLQSAFARLRRTEPVIADLYADNRLWESAPAEAAAGELSRRLAQTLLRQREAAVESLTRRNATIGAPFRWLLTIGAAVWFPIAQPILEAALTSGATLGYRAIGGLLVAVLGAGYLLKSVGFLCIWFLALWLWLRWSTRRRVDRLMDQWARLPQQHDALSLTQTALSWMQELVAPLRNAEQKVTNLAERMGQFERSNRKAG